MGYRNEEEILLENILKNADPIMAGQKAKGDINTRQATEFKNKDRTSELRGTMHFKNMFLLATLKKPMRNQWGVNVQCNKDVNNKFDR